MASRTAGWIWGLAVLALLVGCEDKSDRSDAAAGTSEGSEPAADPPSGPRIVRPDASAPTGDTVVARAGSIEVNFGDYRRFMRRSRLFAPRRDGRVRPIPAERKANPRLQTQTVRSLLEIRVLSNVADERGVSVDDKEITEFVRGHDRLSRWSGSLVADAGGVSLPDDLGAEDLRAVARRRLLRRKLRDELVERPGADELWELYRRRHTEIRIGYLAADNTPTSEAIDAFLEEHGGDASDRIREYYRSHADTFRMPKLVELAVVRPKPGTEAKSAELERAAKLLSAGKSPEVVAGKLDLEFDAQAFLRRKENRKAFGAGRGATGFQMEGPRGAYAWRVEGWREGELPELDRGLRREVAAAILGESIVPSARRRIESVLEAMREAAGRADWPIEEEEELAPVRRTLGDTGASLRTTKPFAHDDRGRVPGLGLARPVMEKAFELSREAPVAEEPIKTRGRVVALMLLDRNEASREAFRDDLESFRESVLERRRKRAVQKFLDNWFSEHRPDVDLEPIQVEYGRLKK